MSKRETHSLLNMLTNVIQGLSDEHYAKLLNGSATLQYVEGNSKEDINQEFRELSTSLRKRNSPEAKRLLNSYKKPFLQSYCQFIGVEIKTRDTKGRLCQKILAHFKLEDVEKEVPHDFTEISALLYRQTNLEDALDLLKSHPVSQTKVNLIRLAKHLDVFTTSKDKKDEIIEKIIDSVVGSKIRGKVIRNKSE